MVSLAALTHLVILINWYEKDLISIISGDILFGYKRTVACKTK